MVEDADGGLLTKGFLEEGWVWGGFELQVQFFKTIIV